MILNVLINIIISTRFASEYCTKTIRNTNFKKFQSFPIFHLADLHRTFSCENPGYGNHKMTLVIYDVINPDKVGNNTDFVISNVGSLKNINTTLFI